MRRIINVLLLTMFLTLLFGCKKNDKAYKKKDNNIYFGLYPKTLETNSKKINRLNKLSKKPSENNNWVSYNYYEEDIISSYMNYIDIDLNNDGIKDYRGVYLEKYRPSYTNYSSSESNSYIDDNGFALNNVYWFKYEKIEWTILEENDSEMYLLSKTILDSQDFNHISENENNYELSTIKEWLNNDFYNMAFNVKEKEITINDISLLSYEEIKKYFIEEKSRRAVGSDYAKIQGLYVSTITYSNYILCTPSEFTNNDVYYIDYDGAIHGEGIVIKNAINNTDKGIRPVIRIKK